MPDLVYERLKNAKIDLHSAWIFDVPELFRDPEQLYNRLAWGRWIQASHRTLTCASASLTSSYDTHEITA